MQLWPPGWHLKKYNRIFIVSEKTEKSYLLKLIELYISDL